MDGTLPLCTCFILLKGVQASFKDDWLEELQVQHLLLMAYGYGHEDDEKLPVIVIEDSRNRKYMTEELKQTVLQMKKPPLALWYISDEKPTT